MSIPNELLLILTLPVYYGMAVLAYRLLGRAGIYAFTAFATIVANIEVLALVEAFGLQMTLGNVLFATIFTCSEILCEMENEKAAKLTVPISAGVTVLFAILAQSWTWYTTDASTTILSSFANAPRVLIASLLVNVISQYVQIWVYERIWTVQKRSLAGLWIRSNGATLIAQLVNTILFTVFAFAGIFDTTTLWQVMLTSYTIFIVTSLFDTPVLYFTRWLERRWPKSKAA